MAEETKATIEEEIVDEQPASEDETVQAETSLEAELAVAKAALEEQAQKYLRLQADYDNYRRRTQKEKSELSVQVTQDLIGELLPVIDNFDRALAADGDIKTGVEMVHRQFMGILHQNGLEVIRTEGELFDPNFHQAVMREENTEKPDGSILQELQKGYMVKNKTIRPSMVKVSFQ